MESDLLINEVGREEVPVGFGDGNLEIERNQRMQTEVC